MNPLVKIKKVEFAIHREYHDVEKQIQMKAQMQTLMPSQLMQMKTHYHGGVSIMLAYYQ